VHTRGLAMRTPRAYPRGGRGLPLRLETVTLRHNARILRRALPAQKGGLGKVPPTRSLRLIFLKKWVPIFALEKEHITPAPTVGVRWNQGEKGGSTFHRF